ncbi:MAG: CCA tRNA nucleotidyltransferase [Gemmatimonadetes bacterium]|nr:CCA tRNA nucleotidyltransferase [Gemmatimonadota bacterium]
MSIPKPGPAAAFPPALPIPEEVLAIARQLEAAGFETWCVGGAVRDNLLQRENKDFDLATAATPGDVQRIFSHTVPLGVEHGTVAVLDRHRRPHEVTTFRRDVKTDGRHAVVEFGVSLDEDLARRDFTINAIAHHPLRHEWRDPFDGRGDLGKGIVRAVGEPERRFREDYLRILRAIRFSTRFGFAIEAATWAAARAESPGLQHLSAERVRGEWFGALVSAERPADVVKRWGEVGALERWLPEIDETRSEGLDRFPTRDPVLMTAYLSRDPAATLTRLRAANAETERGRRVAAHRDRWPDPARDGDVRRWMSSAFASVDDLVILAAVSDPTAGARLGDAVTRVRAAGAPLSLGDLVVTGRDLQDIGVPAGPGLGVILRRLLGVVLADPARNTKEHLLEAAKALAAEPRT